MSSIPDNTQLDSYNKSDYSSFTQIDADGDGNLDDVYLDESTSTLYVGDNFAEGQTISIAALEETYGDIENVVLDDDDGNTGTVNIDADIDSLIIDNDFNTENEDNVSGQANANVSISNQDDELDITVSMDSVIRTNDNGEVGTNLQMDIDSSDVNFSADSYQTNYIETNDNNVTSLDAHNFATINTDGEVKISGTVNQTNSFEIGESFSMPEALTDWMTTAGMISSPDDITGTSNYTVSAGETLPPDASKIWSAEVSGTEVVALRDESNTILGYMVGTGNNATYFEANCDGSLLNTVEDLENSNEQVTIYKADGSSDVQIIVPPPPPVSVISGSAWGGDGDGGDGDGDPDNTFTINANSGNLDIGDLTTNQVNEGSLSATLGQLDDFLVQNNFNVNTADEATVEGFQAENHTQDIDVDILGYGGDISLVGGNTITEDNTEFTHDGQTASINIKGNSTVNVDGMNNVSDDNVSTDANGYILSGEMEWDSDYLMKLMMSWIMSNSSDSVFKDTTSTDTITRTQIETDLQNIGVSGELISSTLDTILGSSESMTVSDISSSITSSIGSSGSII